MAAALAAAAGGTAHAEQGYKGLFTKPVVNTSGTSTTTGGAYVSGRRVVMPDGRAQRLDASPRGYLLGSGVPWARISPDGRLVAYETWIRERRVNRMKPLEVQGVEAGDALGTPQVRVRDTSRRREIAMEPGTMSASFRADGAIAYARGTHPALRASTPYLTHLFVRRHARAEAARWSAEADRFSVLGWAGGRLLVQRNMPAAPSELVVFDAPRRARVLATGAELIAISPDGDSALVYFGGQISGRAKLALIRLDDGSVINTLPADHLADPGSGHKVEWMRGPGTWQGDMALVSTDRGFLVMRVTGTSIRPLRVLDVARVDDGPTDASLRHPRFAGRDGRVVVGWTTKGTSDNPRAGLQYSCNWVSATCSRVTTSLGAVPRPAVDLSAAAPRTLEPTVSSQVEIPDGRDPVSVGGTSLDGHRDGHAHGADVVTPSLDPTVESEALGIFGTASPCGPFDGPARDQPEILPPVSAQDSQTQPVTAQQAADIAQDPTLCAVSGEFYAQFHFYRKEPKRSTLYYRRYHQRNGANPMVAEDAWLSGSGVNTDTCHVGSGWLPTGWYTIRDHVNNKNDTIKGRVWWLSDKQCGSGTWRTELFIHTEETSNNSQNNKIESQVFTPESPNDYYSNGCIKVSYHDMHQLHRLWSDWDGRHGGANVANGLRVY